VIGAACCEAKQALDAERAARAKKIPRGSVR